MQHQLILVNMTILTWMYEIHSKITVEIIFTFNNILHIWSTFHIIKLYSFESFMAMFPYYFFLHRQEFIFSMDRRCRFRYQDVKMEILACENLNQNCWCETNFKIHHKKTLTEKNTQTQILKKHEKIKRKLDLIKLRKNIETSSLSLIKRWKVKHKYLFEN